MANYYNKYSDAEILAALDATGHDEMEAAAAILVSRGVEVDASGLLSFFGKKKKGAATATDTPKGSLLGRAKKAVIGQSKESKLREARIENAVLNARIEAMEKKSKDVSGSARKMWY